VTNPIAAVLAQVARGTSTVAEMEVRTGLPNELLRAALDHLIRTGRINAEALNGCAPAGCTGCSLTTSCAFAGSRRPVLLTLAGSANR
jgi:hypothetical protein